MRTSAPTELGAAPQLASARQDEHEQAALLDRLRAGHIDALEELYKEYRVPIFGFLVRLTRDRWAAEDLFQNTWIKVSRAIQCLRPDTELRAWLFTIARNEFRSHRRWQLVDLGRVFLLGLPGREAATETSFEFEREADRELLERALGRLSDPDREVLLLVGVEELTPQQAATVLGLSYAALRQRLVRARSRLREHLIELGWK
jgi:RNA polymerase sigma-70 factor (ECF subfamily)